jgi:hypothetical protein
MEVVDHVTRKTKSKRKSTTVRERIVPQLEVTLRLAKPYGPRAAAQAAAHLEGIKRRSPYRVVRLTAEGRTLTGAFRTLGFERINGSADPTERGAEAVEGAGLLRALLFLYRGVAAIGPP